MLNNLLPRTNRILAWMTQLEEEVAKSEQVEGGQIEAMEPDVSEGEIPLKSSDSEDALCGWSQYKSEL
ncbi:unnamed protein product [Camellia sinensis]